MVVRVDVSPAVLAWAKARSGVDEASLAHRFPKLAEWEHGDRSPTLKQLEDFAAATHTPIGYLLLGEPPVEQVPIPDYRTMGDFGVTRPSADLLDTIFHCQQRQEWYRSFAQVNQEDRVPFVGSLTTQTPVVEAASAMREALHFEVSERGPTFTEALRRLAEDAEERGVLVMVNGVVGSNTHRKLNPREFRGFALVDQLAPLVFVNGADTKAAQIFTLAHELAHLWLGESALSDADLTIRPSLVGERWCNEVAAEFLVPMALVAAEFNESEERTAALDRLAIRFKVSTLVVLRRLHDAGHLGWDAYRLAYQTELARVLALLGERADSGGNFYNTQPVRVSKRFARALISSTLEGQTLYTEAFEMLGFKKLSTFRELSSRLGVA
ncbi:MAG: ImmA/IrrE family metallo-endopeptidase [Actinomycetota bacterium]|nr:ImmA/IrrE family metallo-endopeptidase [Actinomycetota bacterium]